MGNPLRETGQMALAKAILEDLYRTEAGMRGLWAWRGDFWRWGGRWEVMGKQEVEDEVIGWLSGAYVVVEKKGEVAGCKRLEWNGRMMGEVVRCLESLTRLRGVERIPTWVGVEGMGNPEFCLGFEDVVVDVGAWARGGECVTYRRDESFFDYQVVRCKWDEGARSPTLERVLGEWGGGDEKWTEIWLREMGYRGLGFRGYRTWFMHYGETQSGKSTTEAIERLVWGNEGYVGKRMKALGRQFGLHKLARARRLVIGETVDLEKADQNEAGALLKNVVGRDAIDLDRKYKEELENVVSDAVVVMLGNRLPRLPNEGRGLSSKMVPLNFDVSFEGARDERLVEKVALELQGVARMMVEGAVRLVAATEKWPLTDGAKYALERFEGSNSEADEFLEDCFERNAEGFVATEIVWAYYEKWVGGARGRAVVGRRNFNGWVEENNSWGVKATRRYGHPREMRGISLRKGG